MKVALGSEALMVGEALIDQICTDVSSRSSNGRKQRQQKHQGSNIVDFATMPIR